jgi:hypothetical protein
VLPHGREPHWALPPCPACATIRRWLAEAGMVLRDPPALHLLAAQVLDVLYR